MIKIIFTLIFCLLTIIVDKSNCGVIIMSNGITNSDKFNIYPQNDILHCGSLTCPITSRCIITQKNNPNNSAELITREKCFDNDDNLIQQSELIEAGGDPNHIINTRIESGSGSSYIYNPELQSQIKEHVHKTVTQTLQTVQDNLQNILGKSFLTTGELNFGNEFPFGPKNNPFGPGFPFTDEDQHKIIPLDNNEGRQLLEPHVGYEISEQSKPVPDNKKKNTREDIDSDEEVTSIRKY